MRVLARCTGLLGIAASFAIAGCGGGSSSAVAGLPVDYELNVVSTNPGLGVPIKASPADVNGSTGGTTGILMLRYAAGTAVTLTAPANSGTTLFGAWTGCGATTTNVCSVTVNADARLSADYVAAPKGVALVTVTPGVLSLSIGSGQQFTATAGGTGSFDPTVTWSVVAATGSTAGPGTITTAGAYQTPYPAPPSVTVTATSNADPTVSGNAVVTLAPPATATGPTLTVDATAPTHPISPLIYGMNSFSLEPAIAAKFPLPIDRFGGDATTRYNYLLDVYNSASDYYYENEPTDNTQYPDVSQSNTEVENARASHTLFINTMPLIGWTTKRSGACSYSVAKYGKQTVVDQYKPDCGTGTLLNGNTISPNNDPNDTSTPIDETFTSGYVKYLVNKFGNASGGGVYEYELDNEPEYWQGVHTDVHPVPMSYDELTTKGLTYAAAIKAADPTAMVGGPVISSFGMYFYSAKDRNSGYSTGPCYCYNANPIDRNAHGNIPLVEYYLQHFQAYEQANNVRLLDYLDLHGYYAGDNVQFHLAGDTALQATRLDSTRSMWDLTFTGSGYTDPNVAGSSAAPYAVALIPHMKQWIAADYPGTKTAITEYNFGGQESINGALAQADVLGIFGREGLDEGVLWGAPDPTTQFPGLEAFVLYKNYDGSNSAFGDTSLSSTSSDQGKLSVYGATRSSDGAVTIVVINKTFGDLNSTISLPGVASTAAVQAYLYSAANTAAIVAQPSLKLTQPAAAGGASTVTTTFPASSITLLVLPKS